MKCHCLHLKIRTRSSLVLNCESRTCSKLNWGTTYNPCLKIEHMQLSVFKNPFLVIKTQTAVVILYLL